MPIAPLDVPNVRYIRADSVTQIVIEKSPGVSHRIIDIWIDNVPDRSYVDVIVGTKVVTRLPLKWNDCLFVAEPEGSFENKSILQFFADLFPGFSIEGDEDEDITLAFSTTMPSVHVLYLRGPRGIKKTELGRSLSDNFVFACPITHTATINASANYSLDNALVPTGFPNIADGFVIPSGRQFVLKALAFGSTSAGATTATRLHVWDERLELFTPETHAGLSVQAGRNVLVADVTKMQIDVVKDYVIPAGRKLTLNIDATYDGTNALPAGSDALFLIGLWQVVR